MAAHCNWALTVLTMTCWSWAQLFAIQVTTTASMDAFPVSNNTQQNLHLPLNTEERSENKEESYGGKVAEHSPEHTGTGVRYEAELLRGSQQAPVHEKLTKSNNKVGNFSKGSPDPESQRRYNLSADHKVDYQELSNNQTELGLKFSTQKNQTDSNVLYKLRADQNRSSLDTDNNNEKHDVLQSGPKSSLCEGTSKDCKNSSRADTNNATNLPLRTDSTLFPQTDKMQPPVLHQESSVVPPSSDQSRFDALGLDTRTETSTINPTITLTSILSKTMKATGPSTTSFTATPTSLQTLKATATKARKLQSKHSDSETSEKEAKESQSSINAREEKPSNKTTRLSQTAGSNRKQSGQNTAHTAPHTSASNYSREGWADKNRRKNKSGGFHHSRESSQSGKKDAGRSDQGSSKSVGSDQGVSSSQSTHHLARHFTGFVQHVWLPNSTPRHPGPVDDGPFGSILWRDKKYLISVLIPIGVGFVGAMTIIVMAYVSRAWRKRKEMQAHAQGMPRSFLEAATSKHDDTAPLQESSDEDF